MPLQEDGCEHVGAGRVKFFYKKKTVNGLKRKREFSHSLIEKQ